jgi:hypothetical protein
MRRTRSAADIFYSDVRKRLGAPHTGQEGEETLVDPPDVSPNIEEQIGERQDSGAMQAALLLLFIDDGVARDIIDGIWAGLSGEELREFSGFNKTEYDSKRKKMHRRIAKEYPNGWKL